MIGFKFKHLKELKTSVNQHKSSGPRTPGMIGFKFKHLKELWTSVNQPKSSGLRTPSMIGFKFKHLKELKDEQYKHFIWRTNKLIMKMLINSNNSLGCLHSKDVVLHVRPDLLENMLKYQLLR